MLRFVGSASLEPTGEAQERWKRYALDSAVESLPPTDGLLEVQWRTIPPDELAAYLGCVTLVEADFLGPVFAGIEVTLHYEDALLALQSPVRRALAETAWLCGGPVISVDDHEVRHAIDLVTFPAEELAAPQNFGRGVLLWLPSCERYHAHIDAAVRATLAQASLNVDYLHSTGRRDEVTLYLERYPTETKFWQILFATRPSTAERLRGYEFRAIAYARDLPEDIQFWKSLSSSSS